MSVRDVDVAQCTVLAMEAPAPPVMFPEMSSGDFCESDRPCTRWICSAAVSGIAPWRFHSYRSDHITSSCRVFCYNQDMGRLDAWYVVLPL